MLLMRCKNSNSRRLPSRRRWIHFLIVDRSHSKNMMKKANSKLQAELEAQKKAIAEVEAENRVLQSNLTLEEIRTKESKLKVEVSLMEEKLEKLRTGIVLVKPEDKKATEEAYREKINQWRKRKRIFKELWDTLTDNSPKDLKEFKEELGIEFDEDVGISLQLYGDLMTSRKRKRTS
ncbi:Homologous-pairing protein 2 winged helix domain-containing protein [Dioscorea alata]|uniref:Homologous-pairing protein 2 winged helix domain-containing protein n=1 Tax=Dioscorea alata TaxID=55571 RepID=A0ACB7TXX3_DIOAL|nr:Homologous-pairing protein 2 winged helix domain-containing protein [Dioscorea alata]